MKKRIISALIPVLLCSSCGVFTPINNAGTAVDSTAPVEPAKYSIERDDRSVYDKDGELMLSMYFDRVVLEPVNENYEKINQKIKKASDEFLADADEMEADIKKYPPVWEGSWYSDYADAEVTYNQNGILSIKMTSSWFMGGVFNSGYLGLNYDLTTGKALYLPDILSMSDEDASDYIKEKSKEYIRSHPDYSWWDDRDTDAIKIIDAYKPDQFEYYIEGENVYICYPEYELGPGSLGPVVIPCPIKNNSRITKN